MIHNKINATDAIVVAPMPSSTTNHEAVSWTNASATCTTENSDSRLPNIDELSALAINKDIVNLSRNAFFSSAVQSADEVWHIGLEGGDVGLVNKKFKNRVRCIKR